MRSFFNYFSRLPLLLALSVATHSALAGSFSASVTLNPTVADAAVNATLSGSNLDWIGNGDGLLRISGSTESFAAPALSNLQQQGIKILRYPGGTLSDAYHWKDGIGPLSSRGYEVNVNNVGDIEQVKMGTQEFLELCEALGATPLITVNVMSGTASEAASWVSYVNKQNLISSKTGKVLPKVKYWEIGNEPYLDNNLYPKIAPAAYATQAAAFLSAMKTVDPTIKVGVVLDGTLTLNWNATVLQNLQNASPGFDFAAVHPAYLPNCWGSGSSYTDANLYAASMTGTIILTARLQALRSQLNQYYPSAHVPMAITEHSVNFGPTIPQASYIQTLDGALYEADLFSNLAQRTDILLANHWSASADWYFGGLNTSGGPRPVYYALSNFSKMQTGNITPLNISTASTVSSSASSCSVSGPITVPAVSGYATRSTTNNITVVHAMLLNKSSTDTANVTLQARSLWKNKQSLNVSYRLVTSAGAFDASVAPQTGSFISSSVTTVAYNIPPHSLVFLDITAQ